MPFRAPGYVPPPNLNLDTRPIDQGFNALGQAIGQRRERQAMEAIGQAAQTGGLNALQREAYGRGKVGMGMQAGNALMTNRLREAQIAKMKRAPQGPAPTATMREYDMARQQGFKGSILDYKKSLRPQNSTTVNVGHEKSYDKEVGKQFAKEFVQTQQLGAKANNAINQLQVLDKTLDDPNLYTGAGGPAVLGLKKAAQAFGVKVKGVGSGELVSNISKKIALSFKDDLPGPLSNADRDFLVQMAPGLSNSPEGNRLIIKMGLLQRQYELDLANSARTYASANGRLDAGFYSARAQLDDQYRGQFTGLMGQLRAQGEAQPRSPLAGVPRAVNPQTGETVEFRNGQWVKSQ